MILVCFSNSLSLLNVLNVTGSYSSTYSEDGHVTAIQWICMHRLLLTFAAAKVVHVNGQICVTNEPSNIKLISIFML